MTLSQILVSIQHSYPASLIIHIYWNTKYSFIREQSHHNHFIAIRCLLKTKSMSEIKEGQSTAINKIDNIDNSNNQKSCEDRFLLIDRYNWQRLRD